jgi:hypothetical protein
MRKILSNLQDPQGRLYEYEEIPIHWSMGTKAYRIYRPDHTDVHDVHKSTYGTIECSCGDYQCRKKGTGLLCKHGRALVNAGLFRSE